MKRVAITSSRKVNQDDPRESRAVGDMKRFVQKMNGRMNNRCKTSNVENFESGFSCTPLVKGVEYLRTMLKVGTRMMKDTEKL